ncbi:hypothetical protein GCM10010492_70720 [Saccharothrix mutabilis subsp. mutabilis]|uniref:Uncharacterized protein n=1 Tax=Saccharothrix mutabilis subsp. mutabilis TaxID=66855 RepID=A0ABN0URX9_9PSEU
MDKQVSITGQATSASGTRSDRNRDQRRNRKFHRSHLLNGRGAPCPLWTRLAAPLPWDAWHAPACTATAS